MKLSGLRLNYMKKLHDINLKSKAFLNKYYISTGQDFPCPYHLYTFQFRSSLGRKKQVHFPQMLFNLVWLIYIKSVLKNLDFHRGFQ